MGVWRHAKALDRLENRLRSVEIKCEDHDRAIRGLKLDFEELFDKVKRMMSRVSKRAALDAKENETPDPLDPADSPTDGYDPISKSIMLRRGGYKPPI